MRCRRPSHAILIHLVREDPNSMAVEQDLRDDLLGELGMALHGDVLARGVHTLDFADLVGAQGDGVGGVVEDDVAVHLVDALKEEC